MNQSSEVTETAIFDFESAGDLAAWDIIDDVVMGGRSSSRMVLLEDGIAAFTGTLSLENNGGFASVRSGVGPYDLSGEDGIALRVRGDGLTYGLNVRMTTILQPFRYEAKFDTEADKWQRVYIPFETLEAKLFGSRIPAPRLNPAYISTFGLIIADEQAGAFELAVDWIGSYREA